MNANLKRWLDGVAAVPNEYRNSDIHIDVLDSDFRSSSTWINGAVELLIEACKYSNDIELRGIISAAFSLEVEDHPLGVNYGSCADLEREFGLTPPSLYHFPGSHVPWNASEMCFQQVKVTDFPIDLAAWTLLHLEYREEHEADYRRSFWVVPIGCKI